MRRGLVLILLAAALLVTSSNVTAQVYLRLWRGVSSPNGSFHEFSSSIGEPPSSFLALSTRGESSTSFDVAINLKHLPVAIALSTAYLTFDDLGNEIQRTTYEKPLGTNEFSNFKHRLVPLTLSAEYNRSLIGNVSLTLGAGGGAYFYKFSDYASYEPIGTDKGPVYTGERFESHTFYGYHLYLLPTFQVLRHLGVAGKIQYDRVTVNGGLPIGMTANGAVSNLTFFRFELGVIMDITD